MIVLVRRSCADGRPEGEVGGPAVARSLSWKGVVGGSSQLRRSTVAGMGQRARGLATGMALVLIGAYLASDALRAPATAEANDGPPTIASLSAQSSRTSGENAIRIYGSGFEGTTSVKFGAADAKFKVIDSGLLTVAVPPAPGGAAANNTVVSFTVTDNQGSATSDDRYAGGVGRDDRYAGG